MAHRSRKLKAKSSLPKHSHVKAKPEIPNTQSYQLSSMMAIAILLTGAGLVLSFTWIGILLIFHPEQLGWLNDFLPEWAHIDQDERENPQTITQIQLSLTEKQQIPGEAIPLDQEEKSFLLPVTRLRSDCQTDCQEMVELRVYYLENLTYAAQPEKFYRLASSLSITHSGESLSTTPLVDTTSASEDVAKPLPLREVKRFEKGTPASGVWFYLLGHSQPGTQAITYGQIVYYNPEHSHLQPMLSWTSPQGKIPQWQQVTGNKTKQLVIDQTVGLEPRLQVYQVKPSKLYSNPIELEAISLQTPVLKDAAYENAIVMSHSGLWSPAFEQLQSFRLRHKSILPDAQAQIDVIRLHAQRTKAQADQTWASPSEQVQAELIDGRWQKALQVFRASPQNAQEIATMLKSEQGQLWGRVAAALALNRHQPDVQVWGALILAAQKGEVKANTWLQKQPEMTTARLNDIQGLIKQINPDIATTNQPTVDDSHGQSKLHTNN